MYLPDTILVLKEPRSTEDAVFPYDRVKVLGASSIRYVGRGADEFVGEDSQGVVIEPVTEFAMTLDEPLGRLKRLYDIEFEPPAPEGTGEVIIKRVKGNTREAGLTPEEAFELAAKNNGVVPEPAAPVAEEVSFDAVRQLDDTPPASARRSPLDAVVVEEHEDTIVGPARTPKDTSPLAEAPKPRRGRAKKSDAGS